MRIGARPAATRLSIWSGFAPLPCGPVARGAVAGLATAALHLLDRHAGHCHLVGGPESAPLVRDDLERLAGYPQRLDQVAEIARRQLDPGPLLASCIRLIQAV